MDSLKPQKKSSVCFDKHYISNDPNTRQLKHQKINNVQRSVTNEQQRLSGNSGHYATIQDSSNENTLFTPKPGYHNATPAKRESSSDLYVSFNTGDRLPTSPNNERTPGYSYATNGEIHILRDSNNENHQSEQIQQLEHNGNDENSKHDANMSKYQSKGTDDSDDMYLQPNLRRIGESGNDMKISWLSEAHVYHEPDNGLGGTLTSTYDVCRVSSNKIVTAPNINEKKICSTFKIIPCVNLVLLVAAATASIVAVLMIGDLKAEEVESGLNAMKDPSGSCKPVVCEDIPVVPNGTESSKVINSTANIGTPECEIPGILTTETTSSPVNVGDSFYISCRLRESSCWQTVMVSRSDHSNDSVPNPLFSITYNHASGIRFSATTFREKVSTFRDGVHLQLTFDTANCDDTGVYTCAVIVGDIQDPTDIKNTSTKIKVKERASIKEIIASTCYVQGEDANVVCKGLIGKDENENKLAKIFVVRIYLPSQTRCIKDEKTSKDITPVIGVTNSSHCQVEVHFNALFVITNDMHGAELQCIARGDDGSRDKKSILLNVTTTKIQISYSASTVDIGEYINISTELTYIRGWSKLELRKNCSGAEITIVSIQKNDTPSITIEEQVDLIDSDIDDTRANLTFQFRNVTCSDVCCSGGVIEYISTVKIGDSWVMESESVEFKMNSSEPVQDKFYKGQEAILNCSESIDKSSHKMRIIEVSSVPKSEFYHLNPETCKIKHELKVRDRMAGRRNQCVINFTNGTKLSSNEEILKLLVQVKYCRGKQ